MIDKYTWPNKDELQEVVFYIGDLTNEEFRMFNNNLIDRYGIGVHDGANYWIRNGYHTEYPYCRRLGSSCFSGSVNTISDRTTLKVRNLLNPIWCKEE